MRFPSENNPKLFLLLIWTDKPFADTLSIYQYKIVVGPSNLQMELVVPIVYYASYGCKSIPRSNDLLSWYYFRRNARFYCMHMACDLSMCIVCDA